MIRKLLYRFRRMVLVWKLRWLRFRRLFIGGEHYFNYRNDSGWSEIKSIRAKIARLDATEMSKGEAHVVVR